MQWAFSKRKLLINPCPTPTPKFNSGEQSAVALFAELCWTTVSAMQKTFGAIGTLLRETKGEVALERLNAALPPQAIPPLWTN